MHRLWRIGRSGSLWIGICCRLWLQSQSNRSNGGILVCWCWCSLAGGHWTSLSSCFGADGTRIGCLGSCCSSATWIPRGLLLLCLCSKRTRSMLQLACLLCRLMIGWMPTWLGIHSGMCCSGGQSGPKGKSC